MSHCITLAGIDCVIVIRINFCGNKIVPLIVGYFFIDMYILLHGFYCRTLYAQHFFHTLHDELWKEINNVSCMFYTNSLTIFVYLSLTKLGQYTIGLYYLWYGYTLLHWKLTTDIILLYCLSCGSTGITSFVIKNEKIDKTSKIVQICQCNHATFFIFYRTFYLI